MSEYLVEAVRHELNQVDVFEPQHFYNLLNIDEGRIIRQFATIS
jgi:hypothetical protein